MNSFTQERWREPETEKVFSACAARVQPPRASNQDNRFKTQQVKRTKLSFLINILFTS